MFGSGIEVPAVEGSSSGFVRELVCLLVVTLEGLFGMWDLRKAARPAAAALIAKTAIFSQVLSGAHCYLLLRVESVESSCNVDERRVFGSAGWSRV